MPPDRPRHGPSTRHGDPRPRRGRPVRAAGLANGGTPRQVPRRCISIGPARLALHARRDACATSPGPAAGMKPSGGLRLLDIGCGGGLDLRAAGAPGRAGHRARPGDREHRSRAPARCRPGAWPSTTARRASRTWQRQGARSTPWCAWRWSSTCPSRRLPEGAAPRWCARAG